MKPFLQFLFDIIYIVLLVIFLLGVMFAFADFMEHSVIEQESIQESE